MTAARLIAPVIDRGGFVAGFNWCAEVLTAAGHSALANEAVLAKATMFLEQQEVPEAIEVLKVSCDECTKHLRWGHMTGGRHGEQEQNRSMAGPASTVHWRAVGCIWHQGGCLLCLPCSNQVAAANDAVTHACPSAQRTLLLTTLANLPSSLLHNAVP